MTKKEFEIQKALGLVSWYSVRLNCDRYYRNVQAVSKEDALQRFRRIILIEFAETEAKMMLQNDSFSVRELQWAVK